MLTRNAKIEQQARDDENLTVERPTFVTHLECSMTGERYPADELHNLSRAGKPLLVRYDLAGVKKSLSREALAQRPHDLWRYRELLPVRRIEDIVSLGEAVTPIVAMPKLAKMLAMTEILVKDESRLPTGSFKARGLALAVSMAKAAASDMYRKVAGTGIQLHGGIGMTWEHDLQLYFKGAKASEVAFGDATWHRERVVQLMRL